MLDRLHGDVRRLIDRAFPTGNASELVLDEVSGVVARLLSVEFALTPGTPVSWTDVDRTVGLERLLQELPVRALAGGALTSFDEHLRDPGSVDDDERRAAILAAVSGFNISRSAIDTSVHDIVARWLGAPPPSDYRVVLLPGTSGAGKTWTLFRLGFGLHSEGVRVWVAADLPDDKVSLRHLGVVSGTPCVVLVDGLFPEWADHLRLPVSVPVLIIATADSAVDRDAMEFLQRRRGTRILGIVPVPQQFAGPELETLAYARGVVLSGRERDRALTTTVRHASHLLRGTQPGEHLALLRRLAARQDLLDFLGPLWCFF